MKIDYTVVRTDRKSLQISVERDRSIVVRAPYHVTDEQIARAVEKKRFWLYQKINHGQKYDTKAKKDFVSGTSISYLGHYYPLKVVADQAVSGITFSDKFYLSKSQQDNAPELFQAWYVEKAKERIPVLVETMAGAMGVQFNQVMVSNLKMRWASCTAKDNLNFNWRLIKAPLFVIRYIIAHELAHLLEANHTPTFWLIVKAQVPNYERAKAWLVEHGDLLEAEV
ncbi:YgjP-like metallopeptidase domain-containing protein [Salinisphaera sp. G21_0]|uniref:M48 family metallopeptidase n=1 Tax=Salinisphaera sp. G21_0 TaxID=2821094 RepID=UPI001AD9AD64|nr:M48 family metallopeptidase [Salinisphaera sp. G21_0]